ncbi:MAG: peptidylprolyl isomerase [Chloroflexi bacterium]|nr:peptidylprolyl isomerase [Chloroflexota bacterium]
MSVDRNKTYTAKVFTTEGVMTFNLLVSDAPLAVNNFIFLAREGFYDNVKFHRIIEGFMVQSGDPTGTGTGGPGYQFRDERVTRDYVRGTLAMANAGPNTNGSQFFIVHADSQLPKAYTIFGLLTEGFDALDKTAKTPVTAGPGGERSVPTSDVRIQRIEVEEK